jgi:hypothetical protein
MSDYLTRVAARALGLVDVVRPRLASSFEPGLWSPWTDPDSVFRRQPVEARPSAPGPTIVQPSSTPHSWPLERSPGPAATSGAGEVAPPGGASIRLGDQAKGIHAYAPGEASEGSATGGRALYRAEDPSDLADAAAADTRSPQRASLSTGAAPESQADLGSSAQRGPDTQVSSERTAHPRAAPSSEGVVEGERLRQRPVRHLPLGTEGPASPSPSAPRHGEDPGLPSGSEPPGEKLPVPATGESKAAASRGDPSPLSPFPSPNAPQAGTVTPPFEQLGPHRVQSLPQPGQALRLRMTRERVRGDVPGSTELTERVSQMSGVQPEPAPVVQVTIGRVEVRATAPVPEPQRQPTQLPLLSLDEYLKRRTQGSPR